MSCKKNKRKISDLLDGRLSDQQKSVLENHLLRCASCQDYKNQLSVLSSKVREKDKKEMPKDYALEFSIRLKNRMLDEQQKEKKKMRYPGFEKWAYSVSGFMVVLFLVLYFVILQPASFQTDEYYVISFEDTMGGLIGEINNDPELEKLFNSILTVSLNEALSELDEKTIPYIFENPFYEDELSEENLKNIESKIKQKRERKEDIES